MNPFDKVVINDPGHLFLKHRRIKRVVEFTGFGIKIILLDRRFQGCRERVAVIIVGFVKLMEHRLAKFPIRRMKENVEISQGQFDIIAVFVPDRAETEVGVVELSENLAGGL